MGIKQLQSLLESQQFKYQFQADAAYWKDKPKIPCPHCGCSERQGTRGVGPEWQCKKCQCIWYGEGGEPARYSNNPVWEKRPELKKTERFRKMIEDVKSCRKLTPYEIEMLAGTGISVD